jgi:hypothetical protein
LTRILAIAHLAYGALVMTLSGLALAFLGFDPPQPRGGCAGSWAPFDAILYGALFFFAVPQFVFAVMFPSPTSAGADAHDRALGVESAAQHRARRARGE